jgi:hypothetical protein
MHWGPSEVLRSSAKLYPSIVGIARSYPRNNMIAFYITGHHKAEQLNRLFRVLYSDSDLFLIQLDSRADPSFKDQVKRCCRVGPNVNILPERPNRWGSWSQCANELIAIKTALRSEPAWTHFINLSGQCFPLRPLRELKEELLRHRNLTYVDCTRFEDLPARDRFDPDSNFHFRRRLGWVRNGRSIPLPISLPRPRKFRFEWKGSSWHALSRAYCDWAFCEPLARSIVNYVRWMQCPDEVLHQTLLMNGPWAPGAGTNLHQVYWPGPRTVSLSDLPNLRASGAFFARKFDAAVDEAIVDALEAIVRA